MDHIVIVSQIPLWSMGKKVGGPAFEQTIEQLSRHFRISLVQPELGYVDPSDLPENVTLHQFRHRFHGLWRDVKKLGWITDTLGWYSFGMSSWPVLKRLCGAGDVDLVYGYEIYGSPVARRAASRFGLPLVTRFQGTLMTERRHMRLSTLRFWKHVRGLSVPADLIIMTNDGTGGLEYLRSLGQPEERIRFWMNGYDTSILQARTHDVRPELAIPAESIMLLTVSRLSGWKRVDRAIRLVPPLVARGRDVRLVVVGTGGERERLESLAESLGVADRVVFAGGVSRDELASYYTSADLMLSLYDFSNLANPVIEAMVLGTPTIAYDVGGTSDLVRDGENGLLVSDPDDPEGMAEHIDGLLSDRVALAGLGERAASWARQNLWTWEERMAAEVEELQTLIAAAKAGRQLPSSSS